MITKEQELAIFQSKDGALELKSDAKNETLWASQKQIAQIFDVTPQNITLHLKNIFLSGELNEKATCKESLQVQQEGTRSVKRKIKEYNLDVLIAIGYRIDSVTGTNFRIWATKTLKQAQDNGFKTIDSSKKMVDQKNEKLDQLKKLIPNLVNSDGPIRHYKHLTRFYKPCQHHQQ